MGIIDGAKNLARSAVAGFKNLYTDDREYVKPDTFTPVKDSYQDLKTKITQNRDVWENPELRTPGLRDFKDGELMGMGAAGGAVVGGVLGGAGGLLSQAVQPTPPPEKIEIPVTQTKVDIIEHQLSKDTPYTQLRGADMPTDRDSAGRLYRQHDYTPVIVDKKVGEFTKLELPDSKSYEKHITHSPAATMLGSAFAGMFQGAIAGTAITGVMVIYRHATGQNFDPSNRRHSGKSDLTKDMVKYGTVGAVGGGVAGYISGTIEEAKADAQQLAQTQAATVEKTVHFKEPIYSEQDIGKIPQNHQHFQWNDKGKALCEPYVKHPDQVVKAENPERNIFGLKMHDVTHTAKVNVSVDVDPAFSKGAAVLGGSLIGAGLGVAAAVLKNLAENAV